MIAHLTDKCYHSLSATSYSPHETPGSGKSSTSWCLDDSSSCTGHSVGLLQSVDGDHSQGYHSHQDPYSVTMCVVLSFALTRQLVQMPAAACSIPRTSELLPYGLLPQDLGWPRPVWVLLQILRDCTNLGIWAAFLSVHYCLFLHTCGIYPHNPQNTRLATTSNDVLGQEEGKTAPHFVEEEVHCRDHLHISLVLNGAPLLIGRLRQVQDTPHVCW